MDGVSYMRVKFYVDGSKRKGVAYLDLKKVNSSMPVVVMNCSQSHHNYILFYCVCLRMNVGSTSVGSYLWNCKDIPEER